jgi:hypothetical protein
VGRQRTAAPLILILALAGCSTGNAEGGGVSATSQAPSSAAPSSVAAVDVPDNVRPFARCLLDRGVNVSTSIGNGTSLDATSTDKYVAAYSVCRHLLPKDGGQPVELDADQLDSLRTLAACMRRQNVPLPDPDVDGQFPTAQPGVDTGSDAFASAFKACAP